MHGTSDLENGNFLINHAFLWIFSLLWLIFVLSYVLVWTLRGFGHIDPFEPFLELWLYSLSHSYSEIY